METIEHIVQTPEKRTRETPLIFQHGAWHGAWCWQQFADYFNTLGYETHAISLPGHGNSSMNKGHINRYTLKDYVDTLAGEIDKISPTPVIVAHSLGGAITQKYLETHQVPGAALLGSIPSHGVFPLLMRWIRYFPVPFLKMNLTWNVYHMVATPQLARAQFLSPASDVDLEAFHAKLVREAFFPVLPLALPSTLKSERVKSPVLVLAGEIDAVFPVEEERRTAEALNGSFEVFAGQAHDLMLEPAWQQVADRINTWIVDELKLP